jgi:hypothetical protein
MMASLSAADWLAADARTPTEFFHPDEPGLHQAWPDLSWRGDRGAEAADHLRHMLLEWNA